MALVILGKTICSICGKPLLNGDGIVTFSPFVANEADPLYFFSDGAFHERCFTEDPRASAAQERFNELQKRTAPGARKCAVCGEEIRDPGDYLSFGYIAADPRDIRPLNYLQFHRRHLPSWSGLRAAHAAIRELEGSEAWQGPGLRWLAEQLEVALRNTVS